MASCFYLLKNFEDVNVYLSSIKAYLGHDDDFNWNYGLALAAAGNYKAAEVRSVVGCLAGWAAGGAGAAMQTLVVAIVARLQS